MKATITAPNRIYVLVSGGDGYDTKIVSGDRLENAYLSMFYTDPKNCPDNERESLLEALHDKDNWTSNYALGPVWYSEHLEDGGIEVILLSERDDAPKVIAALVGVARAAFHAADDSEEVEGDNGREHRVGSTDFDAMSDALDVLDELPDDRPGYAMHGPAKAEWALRDLFPVA